MSDSSEDEDLSRFKEVIDISFTKLIDESRGKVVKEEPPKQSERYLETSGHYNDVKVPAELQKRIGAKISAIIDKNIKFVEVDVKVKKRKIEGGVKLFKDSDTFLSCAEVEDTYTEQHNIEAKKLKTKKKVEKSDSKLSDEDKIKAVAVSGEQVMSKEDVKCWKSRRKEKLFRYKANGKNKVLTAIE